MLGRGKTDITKNEDTLKEGHDVGKYHQVEAVGGQQARHMLRRQALQDTGMW